jgi:hypothetical protein
MARNIIEKEFAAKPSQSVAKSVRLSDDRQGFFQIHAAKKFEVADEL